MAEQITDSKRRGIVLAVVALFVLLAGAAWWWRAALPTAPPQIADQRAALPSEKPPASDKAVLLPEKSPTEPDTTKIQPPSPQEAPADDEEPWGGREWPGVHTDLREAQAKYWARVKPDETFIVQKPKKKNADFQMTLYKGHLIEVLADEGPEIEWKGELVATKPVRVGDARGWIAETEIERVEDLGTPRPLSLWGKLRQAVATDLLPEECPVSVLVADFLPERPGIEVLVYSISVHACRWAIGVFSGVDESADLLGYFSRYQLVFMGVAEIPGVRAFAKVQSSWNESHDYHGATDFLLMAPTTPGEMVPAFEAITSLHDNRELPPKLLISSFAAVDPDGDGQWMLQWRKTNRIVKPEGADIDTAEEIFLAFDGARFVPVPRPPGVPDLPPPPPSSVTVYGDGE